MDLADTRSNILYKEGPRGGIAAHAIGSDGQLTLMGGTNVCVTKPIYDAAPLVAVRGFLFASTSSSYANPPTICSYEGARRRASFHEDRRPARSAR